MTDQPDSNQPGTQAEGVEDPLGPPGIGDVEAAVPSDEPSDGAPGESGVDPSTATVEELIELLESAVSTRDEYLDALRRNQADFENYRKRAARQVADETARALESLVEKLLPVLDACGAAALHGSAEVAPIQAALVGTLEKDGLERVDPVDAEFDPSRHEAVMHEPAAEGDATTVVSEVLRVGYAWNGRVIRPAMVKVRG